MNDPHGTDPLARVEGGVIVALRGDHMNWREQRDCVDEADECEPWPDDDLIFFADDD